MLQLQLLVVIGLVSCSATLVREEVESAEFGTIGVTRAADFNGDQILADGTYIAASAIVTPVGSYGKTPAENIELTMKLFTEMSFTAMQYYALMIVFPESSPYQYAEPTRKSYLAYSENIPPVGTNPCLNPHRFASMPQVLNGSCMARNYHIAVIFNMVDYKPCNKSDPNCPSDHFYLFNTNVAFGSNGEVLAVYHKSHIYGSAPYLDQPSVPDNVTFSFFGTTFGMFICYDIEFPQPATGLWKSGVRNFVYNTEWFNSPLCFASMIQQAWSRMYPSNFVAGSVNGGGIYSKGNALVSYFNSTSSQIKEIVVAVVSNDNNVKNNTFVDHTQTSRLQVIGKPSKTVSRNCIAASWLPPLPCEMLETTAGASYTATMSQGAVTCSFNATISSKSTPGAWYSFLALDEIFSSQGTPDSIHLQACILIFCVAPGDLPAHGNVSCTTSFNSQGSFASFDIGSNLASDVQAFPLVSLSEGQLVNAAETVYEPLASSASLSSSTQWNESNVLLSTSLYGLAPM